jgi:hypothetical protein
VGYPPRWNGPADADNDLTKPAYPASPDAPLPPGTPYPPAPWHGAPPPPPVPQRPRRRRRHPVRRLATILGILAACLIGLAIIAPKHHTTTGQTAPTTAQHQTATPRPTATPAPTFAAPLLDNVVAISDDSAPALGNLDFFGDSYSAEALRAVHLTPGAAFTSNGVTFTWPTAAPGSADAMQVQGQQIAVQATGAFATLAFLGESHFGGAQATLTLHYTDGSMQHASLGMTDWTLPFGAIQYNNGIAATMPYHNNGKGQVQQKVYIYYAEIHVLPDKILTRIDFPVITSLGQMQIFAIAAK